MTANAELILIVVLIGVTMSSKSLRELIQGLLVRFKTVLPKIYYIFIAATFLAWSITLWRFNAFLERHCDECCHCTDTSWRMKVEVPDKVDIQFPDYEVYDEDEDGSSSDFSMSTGRGG